VFLTGTAHALAPIRRAYGLGSAASPAADVAMASERAVVIDPRGHTRFIDSAIPGQTRATRSSFATLLDRQIAVVAATP
jgi:hypothetical protein